MANTEHLNILKQGVAAWNQWRKENPYVKPDLSHTFSSFFDAKGNSTALFQGIILTNACLGDVNLTGADLRHAKLSGADLKLSVLKKANLEGADLSYANLTHTKLWDANLSGVDFFRTIFSDTHTEGSNFDGARFQDTVICNAIWNGANGLSKVNHTGPSRLDIHCLLQYGENAPEQFLRGCGVPENFITYMKSLTMNPIDYFSCFISYSHQDKPFARRLHDQLQARGIRCWLDEHQLLPGDDIYEQVDRGIRMWDKVLLCCSQHSLTSWWVDNEVATAFNKEQQLMKDRKKKVLSLIPLNIDGYMFSDEWTSGKKQQIKERLAADFTGWEKNNDKFEEQFQRVVKALQTVGTREEAPVSRL